MLFRQLFDTASSTYTYLIACDASREAFIIDPVKTNCQQYIKLIKELNLQLIAALDTHLHADHVTGIGDLALNLHCQSMMGEQSAATGVGHRFKDKDVLVLGELRLQVIYTPGHTDDSYCFLMNDRVFTGDTLFIRGTGRSDFQHGDPGVHYDSLQQRLLSLPPATLVYPGHDYHGMTVSTIGEEKQFNPRLAGRSREEYIEIMTHLNLAYPKMMDIAVPLNQRCGL
jgi:sulfur dioxygenase